MKKFVGSFASSLSFFFLFLFLSASTQAQNSTPVTSALDSVYVELDPTFSGFSYVGNDNNYPANVRCYAVKITNASSHDVGISNVGFSCVDKKYYYPRSIAKLVLRNANARLNGVQIGNTLSDMDFHEAISFPVPLPGIMPSNSSLTLDLRSDLIGYGTFGFSLNQLTLVDTKTFETRTSSYWLVGPDIVLADPNHLMLKTWVYPRSWNQEESDTLYILPGEYFYSSGSCETDRSNFIDGAITAFKSGVIFYHYGRMTDFCFRQSWVEDLQKIGHVDTVTTDASQTVVWTANSTSDGINYFDFSWVSGHNGMPLGEVANINFYAEVIFLNNRFSVPIFDYVYRYRVLKSIDGILGDFTGDGKVLSDDADEMQKIYTVNGGFMDYYRFNEGPNIGRASILFDGATLADILLLRIWLNNHNDPSVRNLGIGKLISQRIRPAAAAYHESLIGNIMQVQTSGFAVRISTILPSGKIWEASSQVRDGKTVFTIPDPSLQYKIEAVKLPNGTTGVNDQSDVPTEFNLNQNYPNPFNPTTTISYSLPTNGFVTLKVYDILGKEVVTLVNEEKTEGNYSVDFDGSKLASGTYLCRIVSGAFIQTKKMVLMK